MLVFPNAKINLGLFVIEKRSDGFHNIETVLFPIPLFDALEVISPCHEEFCLHIHDIQIDGTPNDNLVYKAYELLKNDYGLPNIRVDLFKKIPFGAGLGGGSADAAFMLKLLNEKFFLNISDEKLEGYARRIGSDCACFIKNKPVFAYEKGDKFRPVDLNLSGYQLVLICPPIHVSTKTAYQNITPKAKMLNSSPLQEYFDLRNISMIPVNEWKNYIKNDFEPSVFLQHPILSDIKQKLYDLGADYASMSGSGSAVFGLFSKNVNNLLQITFKDCAVFCLDL